MPPITKQGNADTNLGGTKEKFTRTYSNYNPAPAQGPMTEVLGTVLKQ